ncbi:MAG: type IX secretion system outer membrane channel protein PorV [Bacteroidia bacterium]|nr:type IX secretion system outer membrane channel protein PorV [Bacteroidia bacterium]
MRVLIYSISYMNRDLKFRVIPLIFSLSLSLVAVGQSLPTGQEVRYNPISTAVPFLTITPDSRHGAMGDVGVATSPDANSQYLNPSKYAFTDGKFGFSLSYTPWLRELVNDINLAYLSGYYRIDNNQVIGSSLRYFSMGDITLTGQDQTNIGTVSPSEFALDFSYSRKLSDKLSGGVALRYIRSDLSGGIGAEAYTAGNAFATDVSFYYFNQWGGEGSLKSIAAGINFSNIGSKISYDQGSNKEFLPANMRLGTTFTKEFDDYNTFSISLDLNKLLVPTPQSQLIYEADGSIIVLPDNTTNKSVISSIFGSFTDAPGGFKEELQEFTVSTGLEYWYNKQFALRAGYFHEAQNKGNRKFFTAGVGVKMNIAAIDFSYVIPVQRNNPLANTIRFTLLFDVDSFSKKKDQ